MASPAHSSDGLASRLEALLAETLGDPGLRVLDLRHLTGGASRETWSFDARLNDGATRELILRREPASAAAGVMAREAAASAQSFTVLGATGSTCSR